MACFVSKGRVRVLNLMSALIKEFKIISFFRSFSKKQRLIISLLVGVVLPILGLIFIETFNQLKLQKLKKEYCEIELLNIALKKELSFENKWLNENCSLVNQIKEIKTPFESIQDSLNTVLVSVQNHNLKCDGINQNNERKIGDEIEKQVFSLNIKGSFNKIFNFLNELDDEDIPIKVKRIDMKKGVGAQTEMSLDFRLACRSQNEK